MKQSSNLQGIYQLKTLPNLKLQKIKKSDLLIIRDWRNSKNIFQFNSQYYLLNMIYQNKWFDSVIQKNADKIMFMIIMDNKPIGICGLIHYDKSNKSADIAIILGKQSIRGIGLGTIVLKRLVDYGFGHMKLHRIGADIFEYNTISKKLFEKLNFEHEVTYRKSLWRNRKWWNILGYSLLYEKYLKSF